MNTAVMERSNSVLYVALVGLIVTLGIAGANLLSMGHAAFNTTSVGMMWGLPIVTYDYFLLTSTGLAMIASLGLLFNVRAFYPVLKRCAWLALAGLVGGVAVLMLELGYPLRALYAIPLNFQIASPLFWKVLLVGAYLVLLLVMIARMNQNGWTRTTVKVPAIALLIAALGVTMIAGSVYGMMAMRPFWFGGEIPIVFLVESLLGGLAFTIFFTYLAYGFNQSAMPDRTRSLMTGVMPGIFALVILVHALFVAARVATGLWSNAAGLEVWQYIVRTPLFHFEVWIGLVLPLLLMIMPGTRNKGGVQIVAAALVMLSLFIARYDYIVGGQMVPLFKGSWAPGLIDYVPSLTEWMLLLMAIFLANVIYALGEKSFRLGATPSE